MIDTLTEQPGARTNNSIVPTNNAITACRVLNHKELGNRLVFIETPGTNAEGKNDRAILKMISDWLPKRWVD